MGKADHKKKKGNNRKGNRNKAVNNSMASQYINAWLSVADSGDDSSNGYIPQSLKCPPKSTIFELHSHSNCSDGFFSPSAVVERAHSNGVKVLALTDHDTMAGVPAAVEAARKYGIRVIPGVEISAMFRPNDSRKVEPVHILAYYGSCGPKNFSELEETLATIREGRYSRARTILQKLSSLKMPLKWEHIVRIAGDGVAPGRVHVARALVEAKYVDSVRQAFSKYLYDGGPAYASGKEILAEDAVQLIPRTGGISVLAHPWALKNPLAVIKSLKAAGLHGMEVYRGDGKVVGYSELAEAYHLLKLGGSDFHGRGDPDEVGLGRVNIPESALHEFLKIAQPIWHDSIKEIVLKFAEETKPIGLDVCRKYSNLKGDMFLKTNSQGNDSMAALYLSRWLTKEERETVETEAARLSLSCTIIKDKGEDNCVVST